MVHKLDISGPSGKISSELLLPRSFDQKRDRCTLAILMHGFLCSKRIVPLGFLSRVLVGSGYGVLRFDFDGYGQSDGPQEENTVDSMIQDAKAVWNYAISLPYVDKLVLMGHSQGGVVAGMLAGRLEKEGEAPAALTLFAPGTVLRDYARAGKFFGVTCDPANPPETIRIYGFKMGREYIVSAQTLPIEEESAWFTGPTCILHGTLDKIVPPSYGKAYSQVFRNCVFHTIKGTGHLFLFRRNTIRTTLVDFLRNSIDSRR